MNNEKIYTLLTLSRMIDLTDHLISYDTPGIFRISGSEEPLSALKNIIQSFQKDPNGWKDNGDINLANIKQKVEEYNQSYITQPPETASLHLEIPSKKSKKEKKEKKEKKSKNNRRSKLIEPMVLQAEMSSQIKVEPISTLNWPSLFKHLIQHGQILEQESLKVYAAWELLLNQLRDIQSKYALNLAKFEQAQKELNKMIEMENDERIEAINKSSPSSPEVPSDASRILVEFIALLCHIGKSRSAKVIHNYVHMATKVIAHHRANGVTEPSALTMMVLNVLLSGLDLTGKIVLPENDSLVKIREAQRIELLFFPQFTATLMLEPMFRKPFNRKEYENLKIDTSLYQETLQTAKNLLWKHIPNLNLPLNEVMFEFPPESLSESSKQPSPTTLPVAPTSMPLRQSKKSGVLVNWLKKLSFSDHSQGIESTQSSPKLDNLDSSSPRKITKESPGREISSGRTSPTGKSGESPRKHVLIRKSSSRMSLTLKPPIPTTGPVSPQNMIEIDEEHSKKITPHFDMTTSVRDAAASSTATATVTDEQDKKIIFSQNSAFVTFKKVEF